MGAGRIGDWNKVRNLTTALDKKLQVAIYKATVKNAFLLKKEITQGIKKQSPGGEAFTPLKDATKKRKGSSKALIDTGFLINAITVLLMKDKAFIGLLRTAINKSGDSVANIGAIMEYGATINRPGGGVIIIPARPFLHPVIEKFRDQVVKNYLGAIKDVLG